MKTRPRHRRSLAGGALVLFALVGPLAASVNAALPDGRGWEMVSPVDKNGGTVDPPGAVAGGGVLQAAAGGGAITYGSRASFAGGAGAPPASQYVSTRGGGGWSAQNITVPIFSGSYDLTDEGVPWQLFAPDLARGLMLNGDHCRGEASSCAVANPPLAGTDAPEGFQDYYLREGGGYEALLGSADIAGRGLDPASFDLRFAGSSPDLKTVVLSTCSALTSDAGVGCGSSKANLYKWTKATGSLSLINTLPGAALAADAGAVSADGSRIYWKDLTSGNLELREGATSTQVDGAAGGGGTLETTSADGAVAFYSKAGHLWRRVGGTSTDITPSGGVLGVLGAAADGSAVYFQDGSGLERWASGATTTVAAGATAADASTWPPSAGAARVSAEGTKLLFLSKAQLTGYNNTDKITGQPDSEVFLYDASAPKLSCVSCNQIAGKRPIGPSSIPGASVNGTAPGSVGSYKPRALSANGRRVFFDSADALVSADSNSIPSTGAGIPDVYQWEAQGEGSCTQSTGCVAILSSGPSPQGASFVDASADGADAYFLTDASLLGSDRGSGDVYDARIGGGFAEPAAPIPCEGDACQILPSAPSEPGLATLAAGAGNPPVSYRKYCRKGYVKRKGICVKKGERQHRRAHPKRSQKQGGKR